MPDGMAGRARRQALACPGPISGARLQLTVPGLGYRMLLIKDR